MRSCPLNAAPLGLLLLSLSLASGLNVLFIGNTLTDTNGLANKVAKLAGDEGVSVTVTVISSDGATCESHCDSNTLTQACKNNYDVVVIQEHSSRVSFGIGDVYYQSLPYCQAMVEALRGCMTPDPRIIFVEPWPHKSGDSNNCVKLADNSYLGYEHMCKWGQTLNRISESVKTQAFLATPAEVAPCGTAFRDLKKISMNLFNKKLYLSDGITPKKDAVVMCAYVLAPLVMEQAIANAPIRNFGISARRAKKYNQAAVNAIARGVWMYSDTSGSPPCPMCIDANA